MFIFYDQNTLRINHVVLHAPPNYAEFLQTIPDQHWIESDFDGGIDEIELMSDLSIRKRQRMNIGYPSSLKVTEEASISNIPFGTTIFINGTRQGTMDQSQVLEFIPQTGGSYTFKFECSGYMTEEFSLEAIV